MLKSKHVINIKSKHVFKAQINKVLNIESKHVFKAQIKTRVQCSNQNKNIKICLYHQKFKSLILTISFSYTKRKKIFLYLVSYENLDLKFNKSVNHSTNPYINQLINQSMDTQTD